MTLTSLIKNFRVIQRGHNRTKEPLRIVGEVLDWKGHTAEELKNMCENLERLKQLGLDTIIE